MLSPMKPLATNPDAHRNFILLEHFEGGLVLTGAEVKSIKNGNVQLKGSFLTTSGNILTLVNAYVAPYGPAGARNSDDPSRPRRVLVHRRELQKIRGKREAERLTIVPVALYTSRGLVKLAFALARGKRQFEHRATLKRKAVDRDVQIAIKNR